MAETLLDNIQLLRGLLTRAAHGMAGPGDELILDPGNKDQSLDVKLAALTVASIHNLIDTLHNRHQQLMLATSFVLYTTFYARSVTPDVEFWTIEINDDIEAQLFLFQNAQIDLEAFVANTVSHPQKFQIAQKHKTLADEFDRRAMRSAQGLPYYDEGEKPGDLSGDQAQILFCKIREQQMNVCLKEIELLLSRTVFCAKRIHLLEESALENLQKNNILNEEQRASEISTLLNYGLLQLENAETMLRYHAARHSAFPRRLENASPQP